MATRAGFRAILRAAARDVVFVFAAVRLVDRVALPFRAVAFFFVARGEVPRPFFANLSPPAARASAGQSNKSPSKRSSRMRGRRGESGIRSLGGFSVLFNCLEHLARADTELTRYLTDRFTSADVVDFC